MENVYPRPQLPPGPVTGILLLEDSSSLSLLNILRVRKPTQLGLM